MTKIKPETHAEDATPTTRSRRSRRTPAVRASLQGAMTLEQAQFEARAARQRWQVLMFLAHELDMAFGPSGDPGDPPLSLPRPDGGQERPIREVVDRLRLELLRASAAAHARYKSLAATPINMQREPTAPLLEPDRSA